jgi:DNA-directed RNA polymerase specialized sigma24 family protein
MRFRYIAQFDKVVHRREVVDSDLVEATGRVSMAPADMGITLKRVLAFVDQMPDHHAEIITMDTLGDSEEEMAAKIGRKPGTVKSRLFRARAALRERFGEI